jgi:hypothetical protein
MTIVGKPLKSYEIETDPETIIVPENMLKSIDFS